MLTRLRTLVLSVWRMPAAPGASKAGRLDYAFVLLVGVAAVAEAAMRSDMHLRWWSLGTFLIWLPALLVRRTAPAAAVIAFASAIIVLAVVGGTTDGGAPADLNTAVIALLIPYSLARWGNGHDALIGLGIFYSIAGTVLVVQDLVPTDRIGGTAVVIAATAVGAAMRTRSLLHTRQLDDVRQLERERLARDLHDTVAHHLTAIAITAQAGLATADSRPGAASDALRRIDEEATKTLAETRKVLRMLRAEAEDAPERPIDDLRGLASNGEPGPEVAVEVGDDVDGLSPTVGAALQRIAREAVANARRHARDASVVRVRVERRGGRVELTVTDDGRGSVDDGAGFGILGMTERATLLGGTLEAGPAQPRGWKVVAVLPLERSAP